MKETPGIISSCCKCKLALQFSETYNYGVTIYGTVWRKGVARANRCLAFGTSHVQADGCPVAIHVNHVPGEASHTTVSRFGPAVRPIWQTERPRFDSAPLPPLLPLSLQKLWFTDTIFVTLPLKINETVTWL